MTKDVYHFGVPGTAVWSMHILFGLFFIYIGYLIQEGKSVNKFIGTGLIVMGSLMMLYHAHLWFYESSRDGTEKYRRSREPNIEVDDDDMNNMND
jgi:hypothetical protein